MPKVFKIRAIWGLHVCLQQSLALAITFELLDPEL